MNPAVNGPDSSSHDFADLTPGDARLDEVMAVVGELRDRRAAAELRDLYAQAHAEGYRLVGLFEEGRCVAAAGYRLLTNFAWGRHMYVDDLVTTEAGRSRSHGHVLNEHLVELARADGCEIVRLDSGVHRARAHRFYFREGYSIHSFAFSRPVR